MFKEIIDADILEKIVARSDHLRHESEASFKITKSELESILKGLNQLYLIDESSIDYDFAAELEIEVENMIKKCK